MLTIILLMKTVTARTPVMSCSMNYRMERLTSANGCGHVAQREGCRVASALVTNRKAVFAFCFLQPGC